MRVGGRGGADRGWAPRLRSEIGRFGLIVGVVGELLCVSLSLSNKHGTCKTVKAIFLLWLPSKSHMRRARLASRGGRDLIGAIQSGGRDEVWRHLSHGRVLITVAGRRGGAWAGMGAAERGRGGALAHQALNPPPYTLHPTPYTLHPTPYTLHPTPYALRPTPYTLHPTPHTLNPKP